MSKRRLSPGDIDRIVEMRSRGKSVGTIAAVLKCSIGAVGYHVLRQGAELPRTPKVTTGIRGPAIVVRSTGIVRRFTPAEDALIEDLAMQGLSNAAIARRIGRGHHTVAARLLTLARRQKRINAGAILV